MRGIDGQAIFLEKRDCSRFFANLLLFNNRESTTNFYRRCFLENSKSDKIKDSFVTGTRPDLVPETWLVSKARKDILVPDPLVNILAYALVKNHFHLILRQICESGVSRFMHKLGTGFAGYINRKYGRAGHLFQGRFRAVHIKNEDQARHIFVYVHTNTLELIEPGWRERGIKNKNRAINFLEKSFLTSYPEYLSRNRELSLVDKSFFLKLLEGSGGCRRFVENWILHKAEIANFGNIHLE